MSISESWQLLADLLATNKDGRRNLFALLSAIDAPDDMPFLSLVLNGLIDLYTAAERAGCADILVDFSDHVKTARHLVAQTASIPQLIGGNRIGKGHATQSGCDIVTNPLVGICASSHPIYAVIPAVTRQTGCRDSLQYLKVLAVHCHAKWLSQECDGIYVPHRSRRQWMIEHACKRIRAIAATDESTPVLKDLIAWKTPKAWANLSNVTISGTNEVHFSDIWQLVTAALETRTHGRRANRGGGVGGFPWRRGFVVNRSPVQEAWLGLDLDDAAETSDDVTPLGVWQFGYQDGGGSTVAHLVRAGLDPADTQPSNTLQLWTGETLADWRTTPTSRVVRQISRAQVILQDLPYDHDNLTQTEIRYVHTVGIAALSRYFGPHNTKPEDHARILICLSLVYGRPMRELMDIAVTENPLHAIARPRFLSHESSAFAEFPAQRLSYQAVDRNCPAARTEARSIRLPDTLGICAMARRIASGPIHLFPERGKFRGGLLRLAEAEIKALRAETGHRLTPRRIANALPKYMAANSSPIHAWHATGALSSAVTARASYYAPSVRAIRDAYVCTVQERMGLDLSDALQAIPEDEDGHERHVGSRICPTTSAVRNAIAFLRERLSDRTPITDLSLPEFHNSFATYCMLTYMLSTGYRAINELRGPESPMSLDDGLHTYIDKRVCRSRDDTRFGVLSGVALAQIHAYETHMLAMRISRNSFNRNLRHIEPRRFVLMDEAARFHPMSASELCLQMPTEISSLPPNWPRHYIANALLEHGLPYELVEAYLGHGIGAERYSNSRSSIPLARLATRIRAALDAIFRDIGATVVQSKLVLGSNPDGG